MPPKHPSKWEPTIDHYPILKSNGGKRVPWNVRLTHRRCNNEDYAWRTRINRMIKDGSRWERSLRRSTDSRLTGRMARKHGRQPTFGRAFVA